MYFYLSVRSVISLCLYRKESEVMKTTSQCVTKRQTSLSENGLCCNRTVMGANVFRERAITNIADCGVKSIKFEERQSLMTFENNN